MHGLHTFVQMLRSHLKQMETLLRICLALEKTIVDQKANNCWIHTARSLVLSCQSQTSDDVLLCDDETTQGKRKAGD